MKKLFTIFFLISAVSLRADVIFGFSNSSTNAITLGAYDYNFSIPSQNYSSTGHVLAASTTVPALGSAAIIDFGFTDGSGFTFSMTGVYLDGSTFSVTGSGVCNDSGDFAEISHVAPDCTTNLYYLIFNNDVVQHVYGVLGDNGFVPGLQAVVGPGKQFMLKATVPCDQASGDHLAVLDDNSPPPGTNTFTFFPTNSLPPTQTPPPTTYNPTNTGTSPGQPSSPILYTSTNPVTSQQEGDSALYDILSKGIVQAHNDANNITNDLINEIEALRHTFLSNTFSGTITNENGTNVAVENWPAGYSNYLSQIANNTAVIAANSTNGPSTNNFDTNAAIAGIDAQIAVGQAAGAAASNAILGTISGLPTILDAPVGTPLSGWTVSIPYGSGYTVDLNPFHRSWVVSLASFVRNLIKFSTIVGLLTAAATRLLNAMQAAGANRQTTSSAEGGILSEIPLVGNILSAAIAVGITAATATIYYAFIRFSANYFSQVTQNPLSNLSGVDQAVWMADQFFPIALILSCSLAYLTFQITLAGCVKFAEIVTRYIAG